MAHTITETDRPGYFKVTGECVICGDVYTTDYMPFSGLILYEKGELLQFSFPDNSAEDCEFLKSGISPKGWEMLFSDKKEEN